MHPYDLFKNVEAHDCTLIPLNDIISRKKIKGNEYMDLDFHKEVLKLANLPLSEDIDNRFFTSDISLMYEDLNKNLNKLSKSQKEMSFNVEEVHEFVQELKEEENNRLSERDLINNIISIVDIIENFYIFALGENNQTIVPHAEMLWNSALKKISLFGLSRIYDEKTDFDVEYNTIVGIDEDITIPVGFIIKTVKSGYIYDGKIIRKSSVIANKLRKE